MSPNYCKKMNKTTESCEAGGRFAMTMLILQAEHNARMSFCGWWWCDNCKKWVHPKDVTYEETHDERAGGCGCGVLPNVPGCPRVIANKRSVGNAPVGISGGDA